MHISKSISKDQRSITFLYETLNNPLTGKNLSIMNVFDLVTELRLMFETNATNESINIKTFSYFRQVTTLLHILGKIANYDIRLICCSKVQKMSKGSDYLFLLYVFLVIDCFFFP